MSILFFLILFFQLFFLPGIIVHFRKEKSFEELLTKSICTSVAVNVFSLSLILLIRSKVDFFLIFLNFLLSVVMAILIRKMLFKKHFYVNTKFNKQIFTLLLSAFLVNFLLFYKFKSILGADIGRFSIISHAIFLKGEFTSNLQPYDLAKDFFYFPAIILFPLPFEVMGMNSIFFYSFLVFFFSSIYGLPVYLVVKELFKKEEIAISSFIFSDFLFNPILNIGFFGVFPYAISIFFFVILLYSLLESSNNIYPSLALFSTVSFHGYVSILILPFFIALSIFDRNLVKKFKIKSTIANLLLFVILLFPYLLTRGKAVLISFQLDNKMDILIFSDFNRRLPLLQKISYILFSTPIGFSTCLILSLAFLIFPFACIRFYNEFGFQIKFLLLSFLLSFLLVFLLFNDMNFARSLWIFWFFYSVAFSLVFSDVRLNLVILILLLISSIPPSNFSYFLLQTKYEKGQIPWIVWNEISNVTSFIKNLPENSTFLIDGGGAGCTGASASYGERIFPLTSRRIFYFSDYCWAEYDKKDYRERVELYRRISINPNDAELVKIMKEKYNVTHILIGPTDVGLNKELFKNTSLYKLVYEDGKYSIFEIL